jgi:hypothetical protein
MYGQMTRLGREPVAGDPDKPHEPLVSCLDGRVECAAFAQGELPLDHVDDVVELDQVDVVHAETIERAADLLARAFVTTVFGLRCNEEVVAMVLEPRSYARLGIAVGRGDVKVVHATSETCRTLRLWSPTKDSC